MTTEYDTPGTNNRPEVLSSGQQHYLKTKRALDVVLSSGAIVILSPVLGAISLAIKLDSPGPVLFKQKRVGKDKQIFEIYKFRSMRTDTPKDMPTHLLQDPDACITKVGKFLRKTSLDELPQLFNIFKGEMSIIGPRPALWNQDDLIEERDHYHANDITPGLTGWAQINGRDELEIPVKAKLDGEYVKQLGPEMDVECFLGTIGSVLNHDGVVEGGTGTMHAESKIRSENKTNSASTVPDLIQTTGDGTIPKEKLDKDIREGAVITAAGAAAGIGMLGGMIHHKIKKQATKAADTTDRNSTGRPRAAKSKTSAKAHLKAAGIISAAASAGIIAGGYLLHRRSKTRSRIIDQYCQSSKKATLEQAEHALLKKQAGAEAIEATEASAAKDIQTLQAEQRDQAVQSEHTTQTAQANQVTSAASSVHDSSPKKVLITGTSQYIENALESWLANAKEIHEVDRLVLDGDLISKPNWIESIPNLNDYDSVVFAAGPNDMDGMEQTEAADNADNADIFQKAVLSRLPEITSTLAKKAKNDGAGQFVFLSSMDIYADSPNEVITRETIPAPADEYSRMMLKTEKELQFLEDDGFPVVILRLPVIYGPNCHGYYEALENAALHSPFFPESHNKRSMIYIDNLCEFIRLVIVNTDDGIFFPQNAEYTDTSEMAEIIADLHHHELILLPGLELPIHMLERIPGKFGRRMQRRYGNFCYDKSLSEYPQDYQMVNLAGSIILSEENQSRAWK